VQSDLVAVGVGEGERPAEGTVDRRRDDGVTVGGESIVNGLDVGGVQPDRGTDAGLGDGSEIGAGKGVAQGERDRLRLEDDGVRRQSMNVLLQALERDGYVTRPAEAPVGKALPTRLTPRGRRSLEQASAAVRSVEVRMLAGLTEAEQAGAFRILQRMTHSLRDRNDDA
jgi:hypothetical protein